MFSLLLRPRDHTLPQGKWAWTLTLYLNRTVLLSTAVQLPEGVGDTSGSEKAFNVHALHGYAE